MSSIRTLIVDDEPLARRRITQLLTHAPDFTVQGQCSNGAEALAALSGDAEVDLVFMDVQMPDFTGLQVLQQLQEQPMPLVVFVTAYDRYTLQAFEAHALDYLLKPLDPDRFTRCLAHVRQRMAQHQAKQLHQQLTSFLSTLPSPAAAPAFPTQLLVKQPGRLYFVPTAQVQYLEATGNYVTVHAQGQPHVLRSTLSQLERQLDPSVFLRIHRSLIVNTQQVKELRPWAHGEYLLTLQDGQHLTSSRSYNDAIQQFLKQFIS
ncbi:LytR/AlgR family response regulator transcription factor [Hymenobacter defluvii]|uniref:Response regulator transcription factor n=1 Tax=Hymenobacter defluvii TaxID=2054411 RepID=A0ABS3TDY2_9BACT|nr:LytTR family DNA-binding domain-containing protein [Hymenobacter defluvii]MBO3271568.1 response regulator transcription factor [Hymenobacter defluvii]